MTRPGQATNLRTFLAELQERCGGAIPVEEYVQQALYHPDWGYYSRNIRTVGRRGDFATSATLGQSLANGLSRWITHNRLVSPLDGREHVVEIGAGTGTLAAGIHRRLGWWGRRRFRYHIVETSRVLREEQRSALSGLQVSWHDSVAEALNACRGHALIFSNELIDAFPPRLFELRGGRWWEVAVRIESGQVAEVLLDRPIPRTTATEAAWPEGQRIEIHVTAAEWLVTWHRSWQAGSMLFVDYGDQADRLYFRRPRGTLRAYFHHQRMEGLEVYNRFGRQDITADVNFTDLQNWGLWLGWQTIKLTDQARFLAEYGSRRPTEPFHDADLADISGAGAAFKVLIQKPAPPEPSPPQGFLP